MTHGDKTKAKAAKTSQASGKKSSSTKTAGKAVQTGKSGKAGGKEETSKAAKIVVKKDQASSQKGSSATAPKAGSSAKETGNGGKASGKARPAVSSDGTPGFTNPVIANAFKRAVKKYSNAFRKLTD